MTLELPIPDLIAALVGGGAVGLGLVVGVALVLGEGRHSVARRFLGGFLVAGGLTLANELVATLQLQRLSAHFWLAPLVYTFALGPLLYFFVRARVIPQRRLHRRDLAHAVLPLGQAVLEMGTGLAPIAVKEWYWQTPFGQVYNRLDTLAFVLSFGGYLWASWRLLRSADSGEDGALWVRRLVAGCAAILGVAVAMEAATAASQSLRPGTYAWLRLAEVAAYSALLYWVAFTGFVHVLQRRTAGEAPTRRETYGMTPDDLARHAERLRAYMEAERPYLDPSLTLGALADALRLGEKELSLVFNEGLGTGYTEVVNGLRVDEARRLLADPARARDPVLRIGMEAGFASKATFNRAFKRATGQTPTAYRAEAGRLMAP